MNLLARIRTAALALRGRPRKETRRLVVSGQGHITPWQWRDVLSGLTPQRLRAILQSVAGGTQLDDYLEVAEQIEERDLHYRAVLQQRRLAVASAPVEVQPAAQTAAARRIADDVQRLVDDAPWHDMVLDLLDGLAKGFAGVEVVWERTPRGLWPVDYVPIDPRWFTFDRETGRTLLLRYGAGAGDVMRGGPLGGQDGTPLPARKVVTHCPRTKSGLPCRSGLAYSVLGVAVLKSLAVRDWWAFAEVFGIPLRLGRYNPGTVNDDDIRTLVEAVQNLASDAGAVLPDSMNIEFPAPAARAAGRPGELFENMARWCDEQTSKAVVGVTMTADSGSSRSQAEVHLDVRADLIEDDQRQLLAALNRQIVRWTVDALHGPQAAYPRLARPREETVDVEAVAKAVAMGATVPLAWLHERMGIPLPAAGEAVLAGRPAGAATGEGAPGETDRAMAALLAAGDGVPAGEWEAIAERYLADVRAALGPDAGPDGLIRALLEGDADPAAVEDLALRTFQARVDGASDKG